MQGNREGAVVGPIALKQSRMRLVISRVARLWLITTHDHAPVLEFYEKRRVRIVRIYRDAMEDARHMKPEISEFGLYGIAIRDEIELGIGMQ